MICTQVCAGLCEMRQPGRIAPAAHLPSQISPLRRHRPRCFALRCGMSGRSGFQLIRRRYERHVEIATFDQDAFEMGRTTVQGVREILGAMLCSPPRSNVRPLGC